MKKREKILAGAVFGLALLFGGGYLLKGALQKPLQARDRQIAAAREQLKKLKAERSAFFKNEDLVKSFAARTFADTPDQASAKSGEMLTRLILQSGLRETDFSRMPFGPRMLAAGIQTVEIGWTVQGVGKLADVVNLLFLLEESPYLHRVENLTLTDGESPDLVRVHFRFLTLVIKPSPATEYTDLPHKYSLYSPERKNYDGIVARDLLRAYVKRPPPPPPPGSPRAPNTAPSVPGVEPGPENYRVVSLSEWMGQPEVHVRDLANQRTMRFKPGENLAGGTITMVDYRPLPMPGNEFLKSFSRVIIKIGTEYWAVERGQTLAQKYRLSPEQLPEHLAKLVK